MQFVGVSGSLRTESTNSKLLAAAKLVAPAPLSISLTDLVGALPLFSPDKDPNQIPSVAQWTRLIRNADGIVVSTPEYARGYPGALKNAFDWLVQGDGFVAKPFTFLRASTRADPSHTSLALVMETMSGIYIDKADTTIPLLGTQLSVDEIAANIEFRNTIASALDTFATEIRAQQSTS